MRGIELAAGLNGSDFRILHRILRALNNESLKTPIKRRFFVKIFNSIMTLILLKQYISENYNDIKLYFISEQKNKSRKYILRSTQSQTT